MDYRKWIGHFENNRRNRHEPDWNAPIKIPDAVVPELLRSLEQFQLGDGGGPASLIAYDAENFRGISPEMRLLVDLWFAEEKEHSRLLGCAVERFGGSRISSHWSFTAFCFCRRVLGVRFELQVLLLTEIVSTAYYRLLRRHVGDPPVQEMCTLILRDETGHVSFHRDRLLSARAAASARGMLWELQFRLLGYAAATMLWANHGKCLRTLGANTGEYYEEVGLELRRFVNRLRRHVSIPAPTTLPPSTPGDVLNPA